MTVLSCNPARLFDCGTCSGAPCKNTRCAGDAVPLVVFIDGGSRSASAVARSPGNDGQRCAQVERLAWRCVKLRPQRCCSMDASARSYRVRTTLAVGRVKWLHCGGRAPQPARPPSSPVRMTDLPAVCRKMLVGYRCAGADAPLLPLLPRFARVPPRRRMRYLDRSQPSKASWADVPRLQARQNSLLEAPDGADRRQRWWLARLTVPGCFQIAIAFDFDKRPDRENRPAGCERKIRRCVQLTD
jgi:hypothetical protein